MIEVYTKAFGFVLMIICGYMFKKKKWLDDNAGSVIATIIVRLTLPATFVAGFSRFTWTNDYLIIILLGMVANVILSATGYMIALKRDQSQRVFNVINYASYNIGCFTIPFLQGFIGDQGVVIACLFDIGNSLMLFGFTYVTAYNMMNKTKKMTIASTMKKLFSSIPFDTYIILLTVTFLNIKIPVAVFEVAKMFSAANGFLAMFMLGFAMKINIEKEMRKDVLVHMIMRYSISFCIVLAIKYLLPFDVVTTKVLILTALSPIGALVIHITEECGCDKVKAGIINCLSIIVSMVLLTIGILIL